MLALAGMIRGNTIVVDNDNICNYDGKQVIITILDKPLIKSRKKLDWDSYSEETERGKDVDKYMEEIRINDRI